MAFETVGDYLTTARVLLQDTVEPYRYSDASLIVAFNLAIGEARSMRPDMFVATRGATLPVFTATSDSVTVDPQYHSAFVYYICGHAQLRDDEATQDTRAAGFLGKFVSRLTAGR